MKKFYLFQFLLIVAASNIIGQVTAPRIYIKDFTLKTDRIEILYGFENCNPTDKYYIKIEAYSEDGKQLKAISILGDKEPVSPSAEEKLTWLVDMDSLNIDGKIYFKIIATKQPQVNMSKAFWYSTLFPGAGNKQVFGKNKLYLGVIGYAGIAGTVYFNSLAATSLENYAIEDNPAKSDAFLQDAKNYRIMMFSSLGVGVAMWGINYISLKKAANKSKNIKPEELELRINNNDILVSISDSKYISNRGLPPNLFADLSFSDNNGNGILEANEKAEISITISNQGKGNAYDLNLSITDENYDSNLKIGRASTVPMLKPNGTKKVTFPITSDIDLKTAEHKLQIHVNEKYGYDMDPAYLVLQTFAYQQAKLSFSGLEILDAGEGTASIIEDGQLQAGELVKGKIVIQNTGQGIANNTTFNIKSSDANIFLRDNTGNLGTLYPGQVKEIFFVLSPNKRVVTAENLPVYIDLKEEKNRGNLTAYQLPIKLNQKPPTANIVTLNKDVESLSKNIARFEYNSKRFTANVGNVINIRSVIPSKSKRPNAIAVVFGVSKYENIAPAPYADNDAKIMKEYFEKVLGIKQVLLFTNEEVTISRLNRIFNPGYGELQKAVLKDSTEVFVFFSGHGIPDKTGENTYLFPYDGIKEDLETFAYNTNKLYENLSKLQAKKVTVILDACFSGSSRTSEKVKEENLVAQKGVIIKAKKPWLDNKAFTMINSSTGTETSLGFDPSETGLFTYFLCAGLQGKADENEDKIISLGELKKYVYRNVTGTSQRITGIQTPEFSGEEEVILVEY